jgi:CxxC motif-containing protein (DUF1111 family)
MRSPAGSLLLCSLALVAALGAAAGAPLFSLPPAAQSGGATTVTDASRHAFGRSLANLRRERWPLLRSGKELFVRRWTAPPLGPLHNAVSCAGCHFLDGRGGPDGEAPVLLRLGVPGPDGRRLPEPRYGVQIQDLAVAGARAEGSVSLRWEEVAGRYPDGAPYRLRRPRWRLERLAHGPLHRAVRLSPRIPPSLVGLGLLEAVPEATLRRLADPADADGDGIAGRLGPGRFGWKAGEATLLSQVTRALSEDLGLAELSGGEPRRLAAYVQLLAVPARRGLDRPEVQRGEVLFRQTGCTGCHLPELRTDPAAPLPELAGQTIRPYTDLLLHDLGRDLADLRRSGRPDDTPASRAWRTAPLWGLGLLGTVTGEVRLLHDGRARTPEEAILWHGGEARRAREAFRALDGAGREDLLRFLESL